MRRALVAVGIGTTALAACAAAMHTTPADELSQALAGRTAGPPQGCIDSAWVNGPQIIGDHTILYRQSGRRIWRTEPVGSCPGLNPNSRLVVELYGSQMCANDRFRTFEPGDTIPGPYCRFGKFVPYDKPKT